MKKIKQRNTQNKKIEKSRRTTEKNPEKIQMVYFFFCFSFLFR